MSWAHVMFDSPRWMKSRVVWLEFVIIDDYNWRRIWREALDALIWNKWED